MVWDVASACSSAKKRREVDTSASLAEQLKAAGDGPAGGTAIAAVAGAEAEEGGEGGGGKRRKVEGGGGGVGGGLWSSRGDGPSHGPVHSFATRNTGVMK